MAFAIPYHIYIFRYHFTAAPYEAYAYDAQDQLIFKQTRAQDKIYNIYDSLGRQKSQIILDSGGTILPQMTTTYDYTGRPQCVYRNPGKLCFIYDVFGRRVGEQQFKAAGMFTGGAKAEEEGKHPHTLDVNWELDKNDRQTSLTWPTSHKVNYTYDTLGQLTAINEHEGHKLGAYTYDSFGQRTKTIFGGGTEWIGHSEYTYGSSGRIEYMRYRWNQGEMDQLLVYDSDLHQKLEVTSNVNFISAKVKAQQEKRRLCERSRGGSEAPRTA